MSHLPTDISKLSTTAKRQLLAQLLQKKLEQPQTYPLSFAQQRLWFLDQLEPGNSAYNIPVAVRLEGELNVSVLEQSLNEVVKRHAALRTIFTIEAGQPLQVVLPHLSLSVEIEDWRSLSATEREQAVEQRAMQAAQQPFDLTKAPLLRFTLLQLTASEHLALLTMHHIISDGWSMGVLIREIATHYEAFLHGKPSPLPELPIQYADYAVWQRQWLQGEVLESLLTYWKQHLGSNPPVLRLSQLQPLGQTSTAKSQDSDNTSPQSFVLSPRLSEAVKALSRQEGVTMFMTLLAAFLTLLYRHSNQDDIVVGTDVANRSQAETESLIGFFVNIVVLRVDLSGNPTFRELLQRVRQVALGAYAHQDLPFEKLVEVLQPERHPSHPPLFQALFVLQNTPMPAFELPGLKLGSIQINDRTSKFPLGLFMGERDGVLLGTWRYRADLFNHTTIELLAGQFTTLLESIVAQPDTRLNNLEMLAEAERNHRAMQEIKRHAKFNKFKQVKPKAVIPQENLVKTGYLQPGETLPLVIQPDTAELDLVEWAQNQRELITTELLKHGAILFRGFRLQSVEEFERVAGAICPQLFGEYGDLPREGVSSKVYGSTPYPAEQAILFHNESSHLHQFPLKILFFCVQAAQQGGETPIVDCRKIYQQLDPQLREKFEQKQLMYVRNYTDGLDVSWQDFFHTNDKSVVEEYCQSAGINFEWKPDGLRTSQVRQAIAQHPKTGEKVFFNQLQLHHISCLAPAVRDSLLSLFTAEDLPRHVFYGDGSPIEDSVIAEICQLYQQTSRSFPWQVGDILMLDNMLTAHGRNPYVPPRKIVVAMGEMSQAKKF